MSTLYWITVLENVYQVASVLCLLSLATTLILAVGRFGCNDAFEKNTIKLLGKALKVTSSIFAVTTILCIFTPSKEDLYLIYGVGETMDYLKENPTAKQLPDKYIKAIDKWVDNLTEKESKKETEND